MAESGDEDPPFLEGFNLPLSCTLGISAAESFIKENGTGAFVARIFPPGAPRPETLSQAVNLVMSNLLTAEMAAGYSGKGAGLKEKKNFGQSLLFRAVNSAVVECLGPLHTKVEILGQVSIWLAARGTKVEKARQIEFAANRNQ